MWLKELYKQEIGCGNKAIAPSLGWGPHKPQMGGFPVPDPELSPPPQENPYLRTLKNSQLLQEQADAEPPVLSWAMPVAAGGGLVVGVGAVMTWRALRGRQKENSPLSLNTMSF